MQEQIFVLSMLVALVAFPLITECTPVASVNGPIPPLCEPVSFNMEKLFFDDQLEYIFNVFGRESLKRCH